MPLSTPLRRSDGLKTARMLSATAGRKRSLGSPRDGNKTSQIFHGEAPARDVGVADDRLSLRSAMLVMVGFSLPGWVSC
jgi:hypothetical protein